MKKGRGKIDLYKSENFFFFHLQINSYCRKLTYWPSIFHSRLFFFYICEHYTGIKGEREQRRKKSNKSLLSNLRFLCGM